MLNNINKGLILVSFNKNIDILNIHDEWKFHSGTTSCITYICFEEKVT
jgi:hypothetical protein